MQPFTIQELEKNPVEHFLGYHTKNAMSYDFDDADEFTLVTSNEDEASEVSYRKDPSKNGFVWVIEGRKVKGRTEYYLREVFRPIKKCEKAEEGHYAGAKKKFDYTIEGDGVSFGDKIPLNEMPWFDDFKKRNGNFGFGLRALRDEKVKAEFLRLVSDYFD